MLTNQKALHELIGDINQAQHGDNLYYVLYYALNSCRLSSDYVKSWVGKYAIYHDADQTLADFLGNVCQLERQFSRSFVATAEAYNFIYHPTFCNAILNCCDQLWFGNSFALQFLYWWLSCVKVNGKNDPDNYINFLEESAQLMEAVIACRKAAGLWFGETFVADLINHVGITHNEFTDQGICGLSGIITIATELKKSGVGRSKIFDLISKAKSQGSDIHLIESRLSFFRKRVLGDAVATTAVKSLVNKIDNLSRWAGYMFGWFYRARLKFTYKTEIKKAVKELLNSSAIVTEADEHHEWESYNMVAADSVTSTTDSTDVRVDISSGAITQLEILPYDSESKSNPINREIKSLSMCIMSKTATTLILHDDTSTEGVEYTPS